MRTLSSIKVCLKKNRKEVTKKLCSHQTCFIHADLNQLSSHTGDRAVFPSAARQAEDLAQGGHLVAVRLRSRLPSAVRLPGDAAASARRPDATLLHEPGIHGSVAEEGLLHVPHRVHTRSAARCHDLLLLRRGAGRLEAVPDSADAMREEVCRTYRKPMSSYNSNGSCRSYIGRKGRRKIGSCVDWFSFLLIVVAVFSSEVVSSSSPIIHIAHFVFCKPVQTNS